MTGLLPSDEQLKVELGLFSMCEEAGQFPQDLDSLSPEFLDLLPSIRFPASRLCIGAGRPTSFAFTAQVQHGAIMSGTFGDWESVAAGVADLCLDAGDYWED